MKNSTVYAELVYFALLHKNNQHVHHLIRCTKKKAKKKKSDLPTLFLKSLLPGTYNYFFRPYITLFSPSDVTAFHKMKYGGGGVI